MAISIITITLLMAQGVSPQRFTMPMGTCACVCVCVCCGNQSMKAVVIDYLFTYKAQLRGYNSVTDAAHSEAKFMTLNIS